MPALYQRKTDFKPQTKEVLVSALKQIKIDKASVLSVAKKFQIPKTNLYRLVDAFNERVKSDEITQQNIKEFVDSHRYVPGVPTVKFYHVYYCCYCDCYYYYDDNHFF